MLSVFERFTAGSFRGPGFDQIRLVAATVVLLHHSSMSESAHLQFDRLYQYSGGYIHFGFFAVAVFFAISGFLVTPGLMRPDRNVIDFVMHRVLRIFPALIVVVIASALVLGSALTTLSLSAYFSDPLLYRYAKNILTLTSNFLPGVNFPDGRPVLVNGALWTLHFEVLSYAALAIASMVGILRHRSLFLAIFLISYGLDIGMKFYPTFGEIFGSRFVVFISLFVYFAGGATLFLFAERIPFSAAFAVGAFALAMIALPLGFGAVAMPACVSYLTVYLGLCALPGKSLLKHDLSYGVYLIHAPILNTTVLLWPGLINWRLLAIFVFSVTLVLAYLSWKFVEEPALTRKKVASDWMNRRLETILPLSLISKRPTMLRNE